MKGERKGTKNRAFMISPSRIVMPEAQGLLINLTAQFIRIIPHFTDEKSEVRDVE